jgi:cellulose synthase/poly-beta-1,6-N-acetylglucosamine synthase-like glycosyltransferase
MTEPGGGAIGAASRAARPSDLPETTLVNRSHDLGPPLDVSVVEVETTVGARGAHFAAWPGRAPGGPRRCEGQARLTIITPTLNRSRIVLERCIGSVNQQTFTGWEHLICSDGRPEPELARLVQQGQDERRRYLYLTRPVGHYGAGVRALLTRQARTEYLAFLDDDNLLLPRFCERMIRALDENPQAGWAVCPVVHCGPLHPRFGLPPAVLTGIPPVTGNIDTLQVVVRTQAMRASGWKLCGYASDGATYEGLSHAYPWVAVDEVLGIHL